MMLHRPARPLGATSLVVPDFGIGGAPLGDPAGPVPPEQAEATLGAAWSLGVRYYDTAPWYGNTLSEHRMGHLLRHLPRADYVLSTKVGRLYSRPADRVAFRSGRWKERWPGGLDFEPHFDYRREAVFRSYEDSLQRLGINQVDALVIHDLDLRHQKTQDGIDTRFDELVDGGGMDALLELKAAGEIKAIGAGINHLGMIPQFCARAEVDFFILAMPYTLADQSALDEELPLCLRLGKSVVIGAVFASGILAAAQGSDAQYGYQPATGESRGRIDRLRAVADAHDVSMVAAALQFPLAHPAVSAVIPGADHPDQVRANAAAMGESIPPAFWSDLKGEGLMREDAPTPH